MRSIQSILLHALAISALNEIVTAVKRREMLSVRQSNLYISCVFEILSRMERKNAEKNQ